MDQKERIIEQAMHMFVSQGIKSVRMDDIAQQLGVSKRTLYELFGDKEGLLYLAMDRYFEKKRIERAAVCAHARNVLEAMFMVLGGVMDNAEVIQRLLNNLRKFYPAVHEQKTRGGTATDELCRLIVLNTASIQLIPANVAAVRSALGCATPFDILPAVWVTSLCSAGLGVTAAWVLGKVWRK